MQSQLAANARVNEGASLEATQMEQMPQQAQHLGNRMQLNNVFLGQKATQARGVVNQSLANWDAADGQKAAEMDKTQQFSRDWLNKNGFAVAGSTSTTTDESKAGLRAKASTPAPDRNNAISFGYRSSTQASAPNQPSANSITIQNQERQLGVGVLPKQGETQSDKKEGSTDEALAQYKRRLQEQAMQQEAVGGIADYKKTLEQAPASPRVYPANDLVIPQIDTAARAGRVSPARKRNTTTLLVTQSYRWSRWIWRNHPPTDE